MTDLSLKSSYNRQEAGKSKNCVIKKDLSRFGREYIEAGRWIEIGRRGLQCGGSFHKAHMNAQKILYFSEKSFVVPIKNFVNFQPLRGDSR